METYLVKKVNDMYGVPNYYLIPTARYGEFLVDMSNKPVSKFLSKWSEFKVDLDGLELIIPQDFEKYKGNLQRILYDKLDVGVDLDLDTLEYIY